ncbi:hypothetical protein ACIRS3_17545 [Streptomyces virginiae]
MATARGLRNLSLFCFGREASAAVSPDGEEDAAAMLTAAALGN